MIKIEIENSDLKEQEYVDSVLNVILNRLKVLKKSIDHLRNEVIDFDEVSFDSLKTITRKIINKIENRNDPESLYNIDVYGTFISNYLLAPNNLIDLNGINNLLISLTRNSNALLKELLMCKAENLYDLNNRIYNDNGIVLEEEKFILKLAFNYQLYSEISTQIKIFFRNSNFVKYCPYCNCTEVEFRNTIGGQVGTTHQLDHFFDKATYPLLSYSMYNLVPSDSTCNVINKGTTNFSNEFHLNPYIEGFGNSINFEPIVIDSKIKVQEIKIIINEIYATKKYQQLLGHNYNINEDDPEGYGNINVFKLLTKYKDRTKKAEKILRDIQKTDKGLGSIAKYILLLNPADKKENYLTWYDENINTSFKYNEFNNEAFSKFNRDIHDHYYNVNKSTKNRYIRELISDNSN